MRDHDLPAGSPRIRSLPLPCRPMAQPEPTRPRKLDRRRRRWCIPPDQQAHDPQTAPTAQPASFVLQSDFLAPAPTTRPDLGPLTRRALALFAGASVLGNALMIIAIGLASHPDIARTMAAKSIESGEATAARSQT